MRNRHGFSRSLYGATKEPLAPRWTCRAADGDAGETCGARHLEHAAAHRHADRLSRSIPGEWRVIPANDEARALEKDPLALAAHKGREGCANCGSKLNVSWNATTDAWMCSRCHRRDDRRGEQEDREDA